MTECIFKSVQPPVPSFSTMFMLEAMTYKVQLELRNAEIALEEVRVLEVELNGDILK